MDTEWFMTQQELDLLQGRSEDRRLGFALLLKYFQKNFHFPLRRTDLPEQAVRDIAIQLNITEANLYDYFSSARLLKKHRNDIREYTKFRKPNGIDAESVKTFLVKKYLSENVDMPLSDTLKKWYITQHIELPSKTQHNHIISTVSAAINETAFSSIYSRISKETRVELITLSEDTLSFIKSDPGRASLETVLSEIEKLKIVRGLCLPENLISGISSSHLKPLYLRAGTESAWDFKRHPKHISLSLLALLCLKRRGEIIDALGDLIIQLVHKIKKRAEKKVGSRLVKEAKEVHGKQRLLYKIAEAAVNNPDGVISKVLFDIVDKETLNAIIKEYHAQGPGYSREVQTVLRQSWSGHYRRMLFPVLRALSFRSNNVHHQPVIEALEYIRNAEENRQHYIPIDEVPVVGIVPDDLKPLVIETDSQGEKRIFRMHYELCLFQALRERLRCKEIWIEEAERYRNPDEDLPQDFHAQREHYYGLLGLPESADTFIETLQNQMRDSLKHLNDTLPP